jgi:hypothetical protein
MDRESFLMTSKSVEIRTLRIPMDAVRRLSNEQRFAYYLLGHIFNELMCLQKIVAFSLPKHDDHRPPRFRAELAQSLFLFRMASGKIWEAGNAIRSKEVATMLMELALPHVEQGNERLKAVNQAINNAAWLAPMRNGIGFHFPTYREWGAYVVPQDEWVDDQVFLGAMSGNTFYDASATVSHHWMFDLYGLPDVKDAINPLIEEMIDLLRLVNSFLEDALGAFVAEVLLQGRPKFDPIAKVIAPEFERVSIPFWTWMPDRKDL